MLNEARSEFCVVTEEKFILVTEDEYNHVTEYKYISVTEDNTDLLCRISIYL